MAAERGTRIVVIGGGAAGMSAAASARRADSECGITVVERGPYVSSAHCGIPYYISGLLEDIRELTVYSPEYFERERRIRVMTHTRATMIEHSARRVIVRSVAQGNEESLGYDSLVLATGARPIVPSLEGADGLNVFTARNLEDAVKIRQYVDNNPAGTAVIVGGGWIGVIMGGALSSRGLEVVLLERTDSLLPGFDRSLSCACEEKLKEKGVKIRTGVSVTGLAKERSGLVSSVFFSGGAVKAGLVIMAAGVAPSSELFSAYGSKQKGAIEVNDLMKTGIEGIFACGDCATAYHVVAARQVYHPLGTTANRQGRVAGANAAGRYSLFGGIAGTQALKVFDLEMARTGLSSAEAAMYGFKAFDVLTTSPSRARYAPGGSLITTMITVEQATGRVLGAQMAGRESVAARIDAFVPIVSEGMTLQRAVELDMSYTPECSPLWDPVIYSLREALRRHTQEHR
ncbi:MAG: FAD-dependent oxidoreductase [Candidatus Eremiobacteraeota bacterium]|nr:FAD-dependent oxidoreductase [Candidatus Eremiobacteraeota bacterium]